MYPIELNIKRLQEAMDAPLYTMPHGMDRESIREFILFCADHEPKLVGNTVGVLVQALDVMTTFALSFGQFLTVMKISDNGTCSWVGFRNKLKDQEGNRLFKLWMLHKNIEDDLGGYKLTENDIFEEVLGSNSIWSLLIEDEINVPAIQFIGRRFYRLNHEEGDLF